MEIEVNGKIELFGQLYRFAQMPGTADIVYGMEGRAATVFRLDGADDQHAALKVFKSTHRRPDLVQVCRDLDKFSELPGLKVCKRRVLTPQNHRVLLKENPDLCYAVLMPWADGGTWMESVLERTEHCEVELLSMARHLTQSLSTWEQHGIAHCDLSGANFLLSTGEHQFVDVEDVYARGFQRPANVPAGSPGYGPGRLPPEFWSSEGDRLAGAVLLMEILGWNRPETRSQAWTESYFDPDEIQADCARFEKLAKAVRNDWGRDVSDLMERVWAAHSLSDCPTFAEWDLALPDSLPSRVPATVAPPEQPKEVAPTANIAMDADALLEMAREFLGLGARERAQRLLQQLIQQQRVDDPSRAEAERLLAEILQPAAFAVPVAEIEPDSSTREKPRATGAGAAVAWESGPAASKPKPPAPTPPLAPVKSDPPPPSVATVVTSAPPILPKSSSDQQSRALLVAGIIGLMAGGAWWASKSPSTHPVATRSTAVLQDITIRIKGPELATVSGLGENFKASGSTKRSVAPGRYNVKVDAQGFSEATQTLEVIAGQAIAPEFVLTPLKVKLHFTSVPSPAKIIQNGRKIDSTPCNVTTNYGTVTYQFVSAHCAPKDVTLEATKDQDKVVDLEYNEGMVRIETTQFDLQAKLVRGADKYPLSWKKIGPKQVAELWLKSGAYTLKASKDGFEPLSAKQVTVKPGPQNKVVSIALTEARVQQVFQPERNQSDYPVNAYPAPGSSHYNSPQPQYNPPPAPYLPPPPDPDPPATPLTVPGDDF